jgi:hypothetical protein
MREAGGEAAVGYAGDEATVGEVKDEYARLFK